MPIPGDTRIAVPVKHATPPANARSTAPLMSDPLLTVLYDGEPMLEVLDDGTHRTVSVGVNKARIAGTSLDVVNRLGTTLTDLRQQLKCAIINPYRDAVLGKAADVMKEIPRKTRGALRLPEVEAVMTAINEIAKRSIQ